MFWAIHEFQPIEFARTMYDLNVISKDIYETMIKLRTLDRLRTAFVLSKLLMEVINNPKGYGIFKESLKKKNSLKQLYHLIHFVG